MDLCNQYLIPTNLQPCNTTSGLEQLPTQLNAQWNCLSPFQPYQPLYQYHPYSHLRLACRCLEWRRAWSGVGAESKKGKWAEQLGRRWEKKSTFSQCLRMVVKDGEGFCAWDTILFFSLVRIAFRWNIPGVIFSILRQFMSPNLVSQQLISDRNSTLQSNMPISTFEASMVNCQWSMVNTFFHTLNGSVQPISYPHKFTAMQHHKWAWTASNPTQRPVKLPFTVPTLPTSLSVSSVFTSSVGLSLSGMAPGLIWSRCRVEKRKVGWATGPQVGEKVNIQPMLEDGGEEWWRFLRLRYYSILFSCKNRFPLEYTRCHIQYSPPIYEYKFGVTTTDFRPKQHTTIKHAHIHFWSLHG